MTSEFIRRTIVPHVYIDTNVLGGVLEGHRPSIHFLETVKKKNWKCSTSIFTLMELSEIRQDNRYIYSQLGLGVHIKKAYRSLDRKNLSLDELTSTQENIDTLFRENYPFVTFFTLEGTGWDRALELKATTNISAPDCIQLATAIEAGCDVLVTLDAFLQKEAQSYIPSCIPEKADKTLLELGFAF